MSEAKFVWHVFISGSRPTFTRYKLLKKHPGGSVTVELRRGVERNIRPAIGWRFFFDYEELMTYYRRCLMDKLESCRNQAERLVAELAMPDLGVSPVGHYHEDEYYPKTKHLKPDEELPPPRKKNADAV